MFTTVRHDKRYCGVGDTILLVHNAQSDLDFLAMTGTRWGIAFPPHDLFDTLDLARRLFPLWSSKSLENVAAPSSFKPGYLKPWWYVHDPDRTKVSRSAKVPPVASGVTPSSS